MAVLGASWRHLGVHLGPSWIGKGIDPGILGALQVAGGLGRSPRGSSFEKSQRPPDVQHAVHHCGNPTRGRQIQWPSASPAAVPGLWGPRPLGEASRMPVGVFLGGLSGASLEAVLGSGGLLGGCILGASWASFGPLGGLLGASWEPAGGLGGPPGAEGLKYQFGLPLLGPSCGPLGPSWGHLGLSLGPRGLCWGSLVGLLGRLGDLMALWVFLASYGSAPALALVVVLSDGRLDSSGLLWTPMASPLLPWLQHFPAAVWMSIRCTAYITPRRMHP